MMTQHSSVAGHLTEPACSMVESPQRGMATSPTEAAAADSLDAYALVLAPLGRDADLIVEALAAARIRARSVATPDELVAAVSAETAAECPQLSVLIVTDGAVGIEWSIRLAAALERQPPWSDLPIVLLAGEHADGADAHGRLGLVAERLMLNSSITVLDRPVRIAALVSAVKAATRARTRQLQVRDLIAARDMAVMKAERAARAKSELLAIMSHEIRTPLNAIGGYVQLMQMGIHGPVTTTQNEVLGRIQRANAHLLSMINNLLEYSRLESGRLDYHMEPVRLQDAIAEAIAILESQFTTKGLRHEAKMPDHPVTALADAEKLRQVLLNLLSNACKFTPPGGYIRVEVQSPVDVAPESVLIHVADTGSGIPAEKLEAIFEPFVRLHQRGNGNQHGTGLGLAISRELARGMGGDLNVASEVGQGSTFTLTLRCADCEK